MTSPRATSDAEFSEAVRSFLTTHSEILRVEKRFTVKKCPFAVLLPRRLSRNLCWLIGVLQGDGNINKTRVLVTEQTKSFHVEFERVFEGLFGITLHMYRDTTRNSYYSHVKSKVISTFLRDVFGLPEGKKTHLGVPRLVEKSDADLKAAYVGGLFDAESFVSKRQAAIEFSISSRAIVEFIHRTLRELGVRNTMRAKARSNRKPEYLIEIYGRESLRIFCERIGFRHPTKLTQSRLVSQLH